MQAPTLPHVELLLAETYKNVNSHVNWDTSVFSGNNTVLLLFQTDTFAAVYKKLTGKEVTFEFPEPYL